MHIWNFQVEALPIPLVIKKGTEVHLCPESKPFVDGTTSFEKGHLL